MLFLTFDSQEERRKYGGTAFMEIQFCRMPRDSSIEKIVAVSNIKDWMNDSLYIHQIAEFTKIYGDFLDGGIYNNLKSGWIDVYGINYYKPDFVSLLIKKILDIKPIEYEVFIKWLNEAEKYNGFYILGI